MSVFSVNKSQPVSIAAMVAVVATTAMAMLTTTADAKDWIQKVDIIKVTTIKGIINISINRYFSNKLSLTFMLYFYFWLLPPSFTYAAAAASGHATSKA